MSKFKLILNALTVTSVLFVSATATAGDQGPPDSENKGAWELDTSKAPSSGAIVTTAQVAVAGTSVMMMKDGLSRKTVFRKIYERDRALPANLKFFKNPSNYKALETGRDLTQAEVEHLARTGSLYAENGKILTEVETTVVRSWKKVGLVGAALFIADAEVAVGRMYSSATAPGIEQASSNDKNLQGNGTTSSEAAQGQLAQTVR